MMKKAFLFCTVMGAALVLIGCANQKSSETTSNRPRLNTEASASGTGGGGGGGGLTGAPQKPN